MKIFSKESGFPYGLKNVYKTEFFDEYYNERICNFKSNDIFDTKKMERIFNNIETKCIGKNVWALFGGNGKNEWICLQVASSKKNIAKEIISDIKCMYPLNNNDNKPWKSKFHGDIFTAHYGLDVRCQKYRFMRQICEEFMFVLIDENEFIKESDIEDNKVNRYKYAEVNYAVKTKALFWNPFGLEHKILKEIEENMNLR